MTDTHDHFLGPKTHRADGATLAAIFVVTLMLTPARLVFRGIPISITPADLIGLGLGALWLCAQFLPTVGIAKGRTAARTALFTYATAALITYGYTSFQYLPADELKLTDSALVLLVAVVGVSLLVSDGVRTCERLDFLMKVIVVAAALMAVVGILQFTAGFDVTRYLKLPFLRYTLDLGFITDRSGFRRAAATAANSIEFGVVCAMVLPLALRYAFRAQENTESARRWWWLCAFLIGVGLMFSVSRSAILGLSAITVVLMFGWSRRRRIIAVVASLLFLGAMKVAVPTLLGTLYSLFVNYSSDGSVSYRTHDYPIATVEIAKNLWLGHGIGTWYAPKHVIFDNQYLETLVEGGVVGLLALLALFGSALYCSARGRWLISDPDLRDLGLTIFACMLVPLLGSATFDLMDFNTVAGITFVLVGASGAFLRICVAERESELTAARAAGYTGRPRTSGCDRMERPSLGGTGG